jgi:hypothetical protein
MMHVVRVLELMMGRATLVMLLMISGVAYSASAPKDADWLNEEIVLRGDYFRAAAVAYEDFSKLLAQRGLGDSEYGRYMSKIDNYNFKVATGRTRYVVWISPRVSAEYPDIFGGSATYILDASTFKIIEKHYSK